MKSIRRKAWPAARRTGGDTTRRFTPPGPTWGAWPRRSVRANWCLYHALPMGESPEQVLSEVRRNFAGEVIYGGDLDVVR